MRSLNSTIIIIPARMAASRLPGKPLADIAGKPMKYRQGAYDLIKKEKPQLFVCGHSHILIVQYDKNINALWVNPGACGFKGFHQVKTLIRLVVDGKEIKDLEVIELGPRA